MVFRKLEQDVIGFNEYLKTAGPQWRRFLPPDEVKKISPPLTNNEGAELFGARLVGRWKSVSLLSTASALMIDLGHRVPLWRWHPIETIRASLWTKTK